MIANAFDHIVVGAGAAGCVVASRLSEDPQRQVLLIEAGRDFPPGSEPESVRACFPASVSEPDFFWPGLTAEVGADRRNGAPRFSRSYQQARIMGGGSSIMGMLALRGLPADYEEWAEAGASGWDWKGVLPYFRGLERDCDFTGELHGDAGPIPIRRHFPSEWPAFAAAVGRAIAARGFAQIADANGSGQDGLFPLPMSNLASGRVSAAMGYLGAEVRRRENLTILPEAHVSRLLFDGTRCTGVRVRHRGQQRDIAARETILCAGALHSPTLLLRSGIGPAEHLQGLGVPLVADRPGVGSNLMNHPAVYLATWLTPEARQSLAQPGWCQNALRYSSEAASCPPGDMFLFAFNMTGTHALGRAIGSVNVSVYKSFSRGSVRIRRAADGDMPEVRFNLLDDDRDRHRLIEGVRLAAELLIGPEVQALHEETFVPGGPMVARVSRPTAQARVLSAALGQLLDHLSPLRHASLSSMAFEPSSLLASAEELNEFVLRHAFPMGHASGTCRMGRRGDPASVCDPECRVIGTDSLRVVDASIMPTIPTANTHLPTLMLAEKASSIIRQEKS